MNGAIIIDTPDGIEMARLLTLRSALHLQARHGILVTRGRKPSAMTRDLLGSKARAAETLLFELEAHIVTYAAAHGLPKPLFACTPEERAAWQEARRGE